MRQGVAIAIVRVSHRGSAWNQSPACVTKECKSQEVVDTREETNLEQEKEKKVEQRGFVGDLVWQGRVMARGALSSPPPRPPPLLLLLLTTGSRTRYQGRSGRGDADCGRCRS
ncbi:hypothetical protein BJX65DRAFT_69909 [Aspergillus insuetus]